MIVMSDGLMWYVIGMSVGIAIGIPSSSELVTTMDSDFRAAAKTGMVTTDMNCAALIALQEQLNEAYKNRADDNVVAAHFDLTPKACRAALSTPAPD
jgi:protein-disulfide isomerase